jgi:hypothetical protein
MIPLETAFTEKALHKTTMLGSWLRPGRSEHVYLMGDQFVVGGGVRRCVPEALVHPELMPAGFERGRATEPIVGVLNIEGIHECVLLILFG